MWYLLIFFLVSCNSITTPTKYTCTYRAQLVKVYLQTHATHNSIIELSSGELVFFTDEPSGNITTRHVSGPVCMP